MAHTPPKTREEFLALPIIVPKERYLPLASLKIEGSTYAAKDDDGEWWEIEMADDGTYGRKYLGCPP
jgi:hypothetical protein